MSTLLSLATAADRAQPLTRPQLIALWVKHDPDQLGELGAADGHKLLTEALLIQEKIMSQCVRLRLNGLKTVVEEHGTCQSNSICCGHLLFSNLPKMRKSIDMVRNYECLLLPFYSMTVCQPPPAHNTQCR